MYHWRQYGMKSRLITVAEVVYFVGSGIFSILALIALILI